MRRVSFTIIIAILLTGAVSASDDQVYAPFVSRLKAYEGTNTIKLTWLDSEDPIKYYTVYRNTERINNSNIKNSVKIGEVPAGKEIFIDIPPDTKKYYYAVLAVDRNGTEYKLFIPYRNITLKPASIKNAASAEELSAKITNIKTSIIDKQIKISFKTSKPDREVVIYRSTSPIQEKEDIEGATLLTEIPSSKESYIDTPVPGVSYYYAVFDSELTKAGKYIVKIGENVTANSTEVPLSTVRNITIFTRNIRTQPLPFLDIYNGVISGKPLAGSYFTFPPVRQLQPGTAEAVRNLTSVIPARIPPVPELYIFPVDREARENSETYKLVRILKTDFSNKNWSEAYKLLGNFLSVRHTKSVEKRTHFYMGQALYFMGLYKESFNEFVMCEGDFYTETKPWLDSLFYKLRNIN